MRSLSTLATLLVGLAVVFWAPAAKAHCPHGGDDTHEHCVGGTPAANTGPFQFVGYSSAPFLSGSGLQAMYETCQFDFGSEARICTLTEFVYSPNAEAPPLTGLANGAWVDDSVTPGDHNCALWGSTAGGAAAIVNSPTSPGTIEFVSGQGCAVTTLFVTCCARLP